jgi:hypothetical protein
MMQTSAISLSLASFDEPSTVKLRVRASEFIGEKGNPVSLVPIIGTGTDDPRNLGEMRMLETRPCGLCRVLAKS